MKEGRRKCSSAIIRGSSIPASKNKYLFLVSISIMFLGLNVKAQVADLTNSGVFYVNTGTIVSLLGSYVDSGEGDAENEGLLYVKGDWTNNGSFSSEAGKVTFWGSSVQNIRGIHKSIFFDAEVNNSFGVTLSQNINVAGTLGLVAGTITTYSNTVNVTNYSVGAINPYSSTSYIIGNLQRNVNSDGEYFYPLGTAANYEIASLNLSSATGFTNILGYFTNAIPNPTPLTPGLNVNGKPLTDMLNYGYWTFTPNVEMTGGNYTVTLNEKGASNAGAPPQSYAVIKRPDSGSPWVSVGTHNDNTQAVNGNTVTAVRSALPSFSDYGIAFSGTILPIELLGFHAKLNDDKKSVNLNWATASEQNSDFFTVERSTDAETFTDLLKQKGAGTSTLTLNYYRVDESPLTGISYYRLRQTDFDGSYRYSQMDEVNINGGGFDFTVLPNPTTVDNVMLNIAGGSGVKTNIKLVDVLGRNYFESDIIPDNDSYNYKVNAPVQLTAGYYFIEVTCNGKTSAKKVALVN